MTAIVTSADLAPRQRQVRPNATRATTVSRNASARTAVATRGGNTSRAALTKAATSRVPKQAGPAETRLTAPAAPTHVHGAAGSAGVDDSALALLHRLAGTDLGERERARVRGRVIEAWLPLAKHLALRFHGRGEPLDDLVQTATIGLIKAIDRFNPAVGGDFVAYAVPTIVGEIKRYFRDRTWDLRVPRRVQELKLDIASATTVLAQRLGRSPTVTDLAAHLNKGEEEIIEGLDAARAYSAVSLSTLVGGEQGTELSELCGFEDAELAMAEVRATLGPALAQLSEREQKIIVLRFFGNLTQTQIAERVGISQMHVSRLLARALSTLRTHLSE